MPTKPRLDLTNSITAFVRDLAENPRRVKELPEEIIRTGDNAWSEACEERIDAIARTVVRQCLRVRNDNSLLSDVLTPLRVVCNLLEDKSPRLEMRITTLADLLDDVLAERRDNPAEEISKRKHVGEILQLLGETENLSRAELKSRFALEDANLTRVLNMMESAGLVDRVTVGREQTVRLSRPVEAFAVTNPRPLVVTAPAIGKSLGRRLRITTCTDGSPESYALLYAQERGLTDIFKLDVHHEILPTDANQTSRLNEIYRSNVDAAAGMCVVRTSARETINPLRSNKWMDVYLMAANVGGGLFANKAHVGGAGHKGSDWRERASNLMAWCNDLDEVHVVRSRQDQLAQRFAQVIFTAAGIGQARYERASSLRWTRPLRETEIATVRMPMMSFHVQQSHLSLLYSFLDVEAAQRERESEVRREQNTLRKRLDKIANIDPSELASHWAITASLTEADWRTGRFETSDIGHRLYWLSAVLSSVIKADMAGFADFVATKMRSDLAGNSAFDELTADAVLRALRERVRMPDPESYLRPTRDGAEKFYWPDLEPNEDDISTAVWIHFHETGKHASESVGYLKRRSAKGDPQS